MSPTAAIKLAVVAGHQAGLIAVSHKDITSGSSWGRKESSWLGNLTCFNSQLRNWPPAPGKSMETFAPFCAATAGAAWGWGRWKSQGLGDHFTVFAKLSPVWKTDIKVSPLHGALTSKGSAHLGSPRLCYVTSRSQIQLGASPPLAAWSGEFALKLHNKTSRILPQKAESHIWLVIKGAWREKLIWKHLQVWYQG